MKSLYENIAAQIFEFWTQSLTNKRDSIRIEGLCYILNTKVEEESLLDLQRIRIFCGCFCAILRFRIRLFSIIHLG